MKSTPTRLEHIPALSRGHQDNYGYSLASRTDDRCHQAQKTRHAFRHAGFLIVIYWVVYWVIYWVVHGRQATHYLLLDLTAGNFFAGTFGHVDPLFRVVVGRSLTRTRV